MITSDAGLLGSLVARELLLRGSLRGQPISTLLLADLIECRDEQLRSDSRVGGGVRIRSGPASPRGDRDDRTRLMTVSLRPGLPNGAAPGLPSGIIREPLAGIDVICPGLPDTAVALASPANTVEGIPRCLSVAPQGMCSKAGPTHRRHQPAHNSEHCFRLGAAVSPSGTFHAHSSFAPDALTTGPHLRRSCSMNAPN